MNISESRIGNFAQNKKGQLIYVCHIDEEVVLYKLHGMKTKSPRIKDQENVQDIKLDRTWLFLFDILIAQMEGELFPGATYYMKDGICFHEAAGKFYIRIGEAVGGKIQTLQFDKVHELQNIFAFIGNELKYKKPKGGMKNIMNNLN
ncbi:MAG: hypothetical protein ACTSUK_06860 [Promethearchaeota archaeon]